LLLLNRVWFWKLLGLVHVKVRKMAQRNTNATKAQQEADGIARIAARNLKEVLNSFKECVQLVQKTTNAGSGSQVRLCQF
jgi:light-regulated signal transduction histidine kinase (bacteriophytochrome)